MADEVAAERAGESPVDAGQSEPEHPTTEGPSRRAFKVVHPRKSPKKSAPGSPPIRSPVLPFIAATLGLVSLLLPWVVMQTSHGEEYARITEYMTVPQEYNAVYAVAGILVLAGSALVMVAPYGSLLTLAGVVVFVLDRPSGTSDAGLGLLVAVVAAVAGCASIIWSPRIGLPPRLMSIKADPLGGHRLNVLAYAAFVMGAVSVVLLWIVHEQQMGGIPSEYGYTLASLIDEPDFQSGIGYIVAEAMVVAGAALCLLTPLGGVVMLSGALLFLYKVWDMLGSSTFYQYHVIASDIELGYGFYLCLAASVVALASILKTYEPRIQMASILARGDQAADGLPPRRPQRSGPAVGATGTRAPIAAIIGATARPAAVVMVVLLMLIVTVMVAFALPFSTLAITIANGDATSVIEAAVYVDGELVKDGLASSDAGLLAECRVTAGAHHVELDYALLDYAPDGPDGLPEWSGSVEVRPFISHRLYFPVFRDDLAFPVVTLAAEDVVDGERISVVKSVNYAYGVEFDSSVGWYEISLVLTDGSDFAEWEPDSSDMIGDSEVRSDLGGVLLGNLDITCTVTDLAGDGHMSQGDYFDLAVSSGSFDEGVTYTCYVLDWGSVIGEVSFTG